MQTSKFQSLTLEELKNDLTLNKAKTSYQLQEIEKTQGFIKTFEDCIKQQKEALTNYILERVKLKEERAQLNLQQGESADPLNDSNIVADLEDVKEILNSVKKRAHSEDDNESTQSKKIRVQNSHVKYEKVENVKSESGFEGSISEKDSSECVKSEPGAKVRKRWDMAKYADRTVHQMIGHNQKIFLCGSKGMLLMVSHNNTVAMDTQGTEDIKQMALFRYNNTVSLAAFSTNHIIVYIDVLKVQVPELSAVKVCGTVYQDKRAIYLPVHGQEIKRYNLSKSTIEDHTKHSHGKVRLFVPCTKKKALISLEDRLLYKTEENDFDILEMIEGVKNVRSVLRVGESRHVCCSKKKLWLLDATMTIVVAMKFPRGIKLMASGDNDVVIVGDDNKLCVYEDRADDDDPLTLIHEQDFQAQISAISLHRAKIYVLVLDEIVTLKIKR